MSPPLPPQYLALKALGPAPSPVPPGATPLPHLPNLGLLQLALSPPAYRLFLENWPHGKLEATALYCAELPAYPIARCPFCGQANSEHVASYSVQLRNRLYTEGRSVFDNQAIGHCYWVDGNDPGLGLRTCDPAAFPYQGITSRPLDHHFP
jgi:hypothetical protein